MTRLETLRIDSAQAGPLTPQQKRFNTLTRQIDQARIKLAAWQEHVAPFSLLHEQRMRPLLDELHAARRAWAFALDATSAQGRWTRAEHDTFDELIGETAEMLLATQDDDPELRALFEKHAGVDYDTSRQDDLIDLKQMAEAMTGMDLGSDDAPAEDLLERLHRGMAEFEAAEAERHATHAASRPKTAAQAKREDEAALATQSVRAIFRKLASALHPDRETDTEQRRIKTELMQRANQAYEKNDLLTLLQLQLQIEQVDAGHMASASAAQLKHYNKVLAEQLEELKAETERLDIGFRMDFGLDPAGSINPLKLGALLDRGVKELRSDIARIHLDMQLFANPASTRRWLKMQRAVLQAADFGLDFF